MLIRAFSSSNALLALCALVFVWEILAGALLGFMALIFGGLPLLVLVAGNVAMVLPAVYTAVAVIGFVIKSRRRQ
jgi:hypothetical protein